MRDLLIWSRKVRGAQLGVLPPTTSSPNPAVDGDRIVASVFHPGVIACLDRETGRRLWTKSLPTYGSSSVVIQDGRVLARTARTLYSLHLTSGREDWSFTPYQQPGEWIYSGCGVRDERVFIGDRKGYLHSLELDTGRPIWSIRTSCAANNDVNGTPLCLKGTVFVATNAGAAFAYEIESGRRQWRTALDGPSVFGLELARGNLVVRSTRSVYLLDPKGGRIVARVSLRGRDVVAHVTTRSTIHVDFLEDLQDLRVRRRTLDLKTLATTERGTLTGGHAVCRRWDPSTNRIYASLFGKLAIEHARSGRTTHEISLASPRDRFGQVAVSGGVIYALSDAGHIRALRTP